MPWTDGFYWIAYYDNGQAQTDQRTGATYADIDRDNLAAFGLYDGEQPLVLVDFRPDEGDSPALGPKRLIWRIRHQQRMDGRHACIHLVGWQRQVGGQNIQSICYVSEAGLVTMGGQWVEGRPLMHPVTPLECEPDLA